MKAIMGARGGSQATMGGKVKEAIMAGMVAIERAGGRANEQTRSARRGNMAAAAMYRGKHSGTRRDIVSYKTRRKPCAPTRDARLARIVATSGGGGARHNALITISGARAQAARANIS